MAKLGSPLINRMLAKQQYINMITIFVYSNHYITIFVYLYIVNITTSNTVLRYLHHISN